jgi:hypothetical protein
VLCMLGLMTLVLAITTALMALMRRYASVGLKH